MYNFVIAFLRQEAVDFREHADKHEFIVGRPNAKDGYIETLRSRADDFDSAANALSNIGAPATDRQQLKAEIAALVNEHFFTNESGTSCSGKYGIIAEKLRQLSAA